MTEQFIREINQLSSHSHHAHLEKGWWDELHLKPDDLMVASKLLLIMTEIAEAAEGFRRFSQDKNLQHRQAIEVELADAVIRIADLAGFLKLDLGRAIVEKMKYNETRPDHTYEARNAMDGKRF